MGQNTELNINIEFHLIAFEILTGFSVVTGRVSLFSNWQFTESAVEMYKCSLYH